MICKNYPNEERIAILWLGPEPAAINEFNYRQTCIQVWQQGHQYPLENIFCQFYQVEDGFLIHVPGQPIAKGPYPFSNLFKGIPIDKVNTGFLEMGEWLEGKYELDLQVSLCIGPDGKVWAEVGDLAELPQLPTKEREALATHILADFSEAFASWSQEQDKQHPLLQTLPSWSIPQVIHWLQETVCDPEIRNAHPKVHMLMRGVLEELESLGFAGAPEAIDASGIDLQTVK